MGRQFGAFALGYLLMSINQASLFSLHLFLNEILRNTAKAALFAQSSFLLSLLLPPRKSHLKNCWDFLGAPVVKNSPSTARDMALIPGQETKIPHASEQLSPDTTTREAHGRQLLRPCPLEPMLCN